MKITTPTKPGTEQAQIDMLWDGFYNHLPHWLNFIDTKQNFILALIGLTLALVAVVVGIVCHMAF